MHVTTYNYEWEPTSVWMVRKTVVSPAHQSSSSRFHIGAHIFLNLFQAFLRWHLVRRDVPVDYEGICGDFVKPKMMCRLSLSKVLIGIGCVHVRS